MELLYLLLFVLALLLIIRVLKLPATFVKNEDKRKLFRRKQRLESKDPLDLK